MRCNLTLFILLRVLVLQSLLSVLVRASAPGDENSQCTVGNSYPENITMLMDSYNYLNLLDGPNSVWISSDFDGNGNQVLD